MLVACLVVLPGYLLVVALVLPLALGGRTLFLRDVFNSHLPMKLSHARAFSDGYVPLVDPYRAGGQPALGNPNGVVLYPDNLLYLFASPHWTLNAHLWLHLLLAPFTFLWLARALGLSWRSSWVAATVYSTSGYFFSQMNFYNLVAGAALAPALAAAVLFALRLPSGWRARLALAASAALWALLLLAGDPTLALQAAGLAALALLATRAFGGGRRRVLALAGALASGTLLAAPQWLEFASILGLSFRGHWGYSSRWALVQSWDPRTFIEWILPLAFGRPDLTFWGARFYDGSVPLFFSLYPGMLCLALLLCSGFGLRSLPFAAGAAPDPLLPLRRFAWAAVLGGLFVSLGSFNPLIRLLSQLPGAQLLRFPIKFWLPVAIGVACLAGAGYERTVEGERRARLLAVLGLLALFYLLLFVCLHLFAHGLEAWIAEQAPAHLPASLAAAERNRWGGLALLQLLLLLLLAAAVAGAARPSEPRRALAAGLVLLLHTAAQLLFLRSLVPTEELAPYLSAPPMLAEVGEHELIVHSGAGISLFGTGELPDFPDPGLAWVQRRGFVELYPFVGVAFERRYDLNLSPEGLDSFLTLSTAQALQLLDDSRRVRLLRALGVDVVILDRRLASEAERTTRLRRRFDSYGAGAYVYELPGAAREVELVGEILPAPHLNASVQAMLDPRFDPRRAATLAGGGQPRSGGAGSFAVLASGPETLRVKTETRGAMLLVWRRAHLPIYRASIDGRAVPVRVANLTRVAVEVPEGSHEVEIKTDRRRLTVGIALAALGLLGLVACLRPRLHQ